MISYKNRYLAYSLVYFGEKYLNQVKTDIIYENQYPARRWFSKPFYTLFIDLAQDEESIFSTFDKNTKYEINRAKNKDNITTAVFDSQKQRKIFYDFYDEFAKTKNLNSLGTREAGLLIDNGMFVIRTASLNNEALVFHTYITANGRARLAHSASLFRESEEGAYRNLVGRANRLLHWEDMLYFKKMGYLIYDLGGINPDMANEETKAINRFKECFGGKQVIEYNSIIPSSLKGFLYLVYRKLCGK